MTDTQSKNDWLAVLQAEAKLIDPRSAEVTVVRGNLADPYGLDPHCSECCVGKMYFACRPESDIWVFLGDLPAAARKAVWDRFLAGAADATPTSFSSSYLLAAALRRADAAYKEQTQRDDNEDWAGWYAKFLAREQAEIPF